MLNVNGKSKVICVIVSVLALFVFLSFTSSASNENKDEFSFSNMTEIFDRLTSETLDENEISDFKISNLKDVSFTQMLSFAVDKIKDEIEKPVKTFTLIMCITLLFSLTDVFDSHGLSFRADMLCPVICVYTLCTAMSECISSFERYVGSLNSFLKAVCPLVCTIEAVSGRGGGALAYKLGVTAASEILAFLCSDVVKYAVLMFFALSACGALSPFYNLSSLTDCVMKTVSAVLGIVGTVFTGFLSVKKVFGSVSDSLALRGIKFAAGNLVPIVGSYVSDGISAVLAGVKTAQSTIIVSCVVVMALLCLPLFVRFLAWNVTLRLIKAVNLMFNFDKNASMYDGFINFVKLMTALCIFSLYICCSCFLMLCVGSVNDV